MKNLTLGAGLFLVLTFFFSCGPGFDLVGQWETQGNELQYQFIPAPGKAAEGLMVSDIHLASWEGALNVTGDLEGFFAPPMKPTFEGENLFLVFDDFISETTPQGSGDFYVLRLTHPSAGDTVLEVSSEDGSAIVYSGTLDERSEATGLTVLPTLLSSPDGKTIQIEGEITAPVLEFSNVNNVEKEGLVLLAPETFRPIIPDLWTFLEEGVFQGVVNLPMQSVNLSGTYTLEGNQLFIEAVPQGYERTLEWDFEVRSTEEGLEFFHKKGITNENGELDYVLQSYGLLPEEITELYGLNKVKIRPSSPQEENQTP